MRKDAAASELSSLSRSHRAEEMYSSGNSAASHTLWRRVLETDPAG